MQTELLGPWRPYLEHSMQKPYFSRLAGRVDAAYAAGEVYPPEGDLFRAFSLCPPERVRAVILGQDPYHESGQAMGLAFSVPDGVPLLSVTKGIERGTHLRMSQVIAQETGGEHPIAVLSGPSHAEEVARAMPTGVVAASNRAETAELVQRVFTNERFRVYTHDDMVGVELAGALKNVAALCCGVSDGLGLGDNTKALLITRAMAETSRLAERLGGRKETLAGLAGMGDLIVTCTSMHSRNRRAGIAIGEGRTPQEVVADMAGVVEGYYAAVSAKELADSLGVEMPICEAMYDVLYNGAEVRGMVHRLMSRAPKRETDNGWV